MNKNYYALIMAGGVGSRFWPASRTDYPKQFIDFFGVGKTLIQSTYDRFLKVCPPENIFIVTNEIYTDLIKQQLPDLCENQILGEPLLRNTAPCIAYGCLKISELNPDAQIVVAPSDHTISNSEGFLSAINQALKASTENNTLITLGIKPSRADTGYGYIQYTDHNLKSDKDLHKVKTFTEKPNLELAKSFIQSGDFLWNSGIFIWSAKSILSSFEKHLPDMHEIFIAGKNAMNSDREKSFINNAYLQCTNISIDFGIMEKADNVYVLPADFGWSDLGTWASIYDMADKDYVGNVVIPSEHVIMYDSSNCMVNVPKDKLVILRGLHDFVVVENDNILMICPRDEEQKVKEVVADVKSRFGTKFI
ncbi:mannose-1-phosphate guanylyltransferase [Pedobacter changchengzhani]|uniref:mannose-1-phosphate guanylyltransferase n=1 Tax=Pedobacter changchengzhani TaxID=2529274 RepID=A0A4V3A036_9SPHI|nr:mannose-1-phosphate guanylyltransferase [Pedobacter changchengzhani]TDG36113.1 mannose-1-phosphate guanylyltransferase [Pedobacter changchengzhani]